jgi:hypothetical protein
MSAETGQYTLFVAKPTLERSADAERSLLSQSTMLAGFASLTLALSGGAWLVWRVLEHGGLNNAEMLLAALLPIGLAYLTGWLFSLVSIRAYHNLVFPLIIRYYSWFILAGVLVLYLKVIQKLFLQGYDFPNFVVYNFALLGALSALFGLHLLPEEHELRPFSIPIFLVGLLQLGAMLGRYVIFPVSGYGVFILGDVFVFALMQIIAGLMLAHTGVFNPLRNSITDFFRDRGNVFH